MDILPIFLHFSTVYAKIQDVPNFTSWELELGEGTEENLANMSCLFDFIMNSTDEEFRENIHEYLNLDSVLNYYLMTDLAYLSDNLSKNMLLFTYDMEVWYIGLYDLDSSWGTSFDGQRNLNDFVAQMEFPLCMSNLLDRLEVCFGQELSQRYFELREDIFTKEYIMGQFYSFEDTIDSITFAKEAERWGDSIPGYGYEQIEEYLDIRIPDLDAKYADMEHWVQTNEQRVIAYVELFAQANQ